MPWHKLRIKNDNTREIQIDSSVLYFTTLMKSFGIPFAFEIQKEIFSNKIEARIMDLIYFGKYLYLKYIGALGLNLILIKVMSKGK